MTAGLASLVAVLALLLPATAAAQESDPDEFTPVGHELTPRSLLQFAQSSSL